jgi:hypothetical protein
LGFVQFFWIPDDASFRWSLVVFYYIFLLDLLFFFYGFFFLVRDEGSFGADGNWSDRSVNNMGFFGPGPWHFVYIDDESTVTPAAQRAFGQGLARTGEQL